MIGWAVARAVAPTRPGDRLASAVAGWVGALCVITPLRAEASNLSFEQAFSSSGEPSSLHYRAAFTSRGAEHRLEVWRDGEHRVKRVTDGALKTYAVHGPSEAEFRMDILDTRKRIHTRVSRTNLYRIGAFTDWFDLTHGLRRPKGVYRVATATAPRIAAKALQSCRWYDLTQEKRTVHVCWGTVDRLPLLIVSADDRVLWRITSVDLRPISPKVFQFKDAGYVQNDANRDVEND